MSNQPTKNLEPSERERQGHHPDRKLVWTGPPVPLRGPRGPRVIARVLSRPDGHAETEVGLHFPGVGADGALGWIFGRGVCFPAGPSDVARCLRALADSLTPGGEVPQQSAEPDPPAPSPPMEPHEEEQHA